MGSNMAARNQEKHLSLTGHLTGCGGADLHNSPTSASSASFESLGIFPHKPRKLLHISEKATAYHPQKQK